MGKVEFETVFVSFLGKTVHYRAAWITQPHHLGAFVKGLTYSVIYGLSQDFELETAIDLHYLGVTS